MATCRPAGERALLIDTDAPATFAAWLRSRLPDLVDVVPAEASVLVVARDPAHLGTVRRLLPTAPSEPDSTLDRPTVELAVRFDGADLGDVAGRVGCSVSALVDAIVGCELTVRFCGFAPGFAYLTGLPGFLQVPRLATPRPAVPAGSFAAADRYAAVYPRRTPGGWHLLGSCGAVLFDTERDPPALLAPGTAVRITAR